ncbi:MAG: asparagine synthase C-terminal domain-containing protein, partial [Opitutales bacterium]
DAVASDLFGELGARDCSTATLARSMIEKRNLQMLLHWEDRNSMAHSVEARVPFLDHRLVEYTLSTPDEHRLKGGVTKRLLREAVRSVVPSPILDRRDKLGFATPEESWIREQSPKQFEDLVDQAIEASNGILRPKQTLEEARNLLDGSKSYTFQLWRFICFGSWLNRFGICP